MTSDRKRSGFTLLEVLVVLTVIGIIAASAAPLVGAAVDQQRRSQARTELDILTDALQAFYYDQGSFPTSLTMPGFYGAYFVAGVDDTTVLDGWGPNVEYVYAVTTNPDTATLRSRGPNAIDDSGALDDLEVLVPGAAPGGTRTRERMRVIVEVLANYLEAGGLLTGSWSTDRTSMGLGDAYAIDGFGTSFQLDPTTYVLRSAGADRSFGTSDDMSS